MEVSAAAGFSHMHKIVTVTFSAAAGRGSHNIRVVDSRNDGAQGHFAANWKRSRQVDL